MRTGKMVSAASFRTFILNAVIFLSVLATSYSSYPGRPLHTTGIGLSAAIFHNREPYRDKTVTIEIVDKKEEDSDNDETE